MGFRFEPEWRITLFTLVMVPTMIGLGFWQLGRAEEKVALAAAWEKQQSQQPVPVQMLEGQATDSLAYRPVTVTGRFRESEYLLLDNRIYRGKFGYEVLGIVDLEPGDLAVVVNRGWIAGDAARRSLPEVPPVTGRQTVRGYVYIPPGDPYLLEEQQIAAGWPKVVQAVEMDKIAAVEEGVRLFPHLVRVERDSPAALTVDWRVINVRPDKHRGYAVQWFTMAAVLAIFYMLRSSNLWQLLKRRGQGQK